MELEGHAELSLLFTGPGVAGPAPVEAAASELALTFMEELLILTLY